MMIFDERGKMHSNYNYKKSHEELWKRLKEKVVGNLQKSISVDNVRIFNHKEDILFDMIHEGIIKGLPYKHCYGCQEANGECSICPLEKVCKTTYVDLRVYDINCLTISEVEKMFDAIIEGWKTDER